MTIAAENSAQNMFAVTTNQSLFWNPYRTQKIDCRQSRANIGSEISFTLWLCHMRQICNGRPRHM